MTRNILTAGRSPSNKKKQLATQAIATLYSGITHELRNHLATIHICTELAENKLTDIKKSIKAANSLMTSLQLQIKGLVTGEPDKKDLIPYSMLKNIKEALELYPFNNNERDLVKVEVVEDFEYLGNPNLTNHILSNLIRNSLRAIQNAGKGEITIKLESGDKFNKLIFKDTASGIPKDFLPKIFELFESQATTQGGTGVGLALCKEIMKSYNGDITCRSEESVYTEFTLKFPLL